MFRCTECGCEYEIKPDYCDCGNDVFVEQISKPAEALPQETKSVYAAPEPEKVPYETVKNDTPSVGKSVKSQMEPISIFIFCVCLILSFLIIFVWNPVKENSRSIDDKIDTAVNQSVTIPDINKIWNSTPPLASPKPSAAQHSAENTDTKIIIDKNLPVLQPTTKVQQVQQPKQAQKTTIQPKPVVDAPKKTTSNTVSDETKKAADEAKKAEEARKFAEAQKAAEEAQKAAEEAQKAMLAAQKAAEEKARKEAEKQEYANYKINLRNAIGRKIDFTKVIGDGDCSISFKIDSSGKLINGAFVKQSTNMTLNDAVYAAFMSLRSYVAPPAGYGSETLKLNVSFYNGNFEISLQ